MPHVQITKRQIKANRVPRDQQPVYEIELADNEQIVDVDHDDRKTIDHTLTVYVASTFKR